MLSATLKSIRARLGRLVATATAVILGISFLAGTLVFTDSVQRAFDELFATVFETTDANVRSSETIDAGFGVELRGRIPESTVEIVQAVDGVDVAEGFVQGTTTVIDADGEPIGDPGQGPPTFGFSWGIDDELNQFEISDGRAPSATGEVVLDANTAETGGFELGDTVRLLTPTGSVEYELVGVARFGDSSSIGGATTTLFDFRTAQELLDADGQVDAISVRASDGISEQEITDRINAALPEGIEAITGTAAGAENASAIEEGLAFFNIFLLAFVFIALFVSAFVIYNTFAILIAQRTRELALFRAIGATRRQVLSSVFLEAAVIGLVGSVLGLLLGIVLSYGLRWMLEAFGLDLPSGGLVLAGSTVVISLIVGVIVTLVSAVAPAIGASRIAPLEALRESAAETWQRNNVRFLTGLLITAGGGLLLLFGLIQPEIALVGAGVALMFVGVFVLGPVIARPIAGALGRPISASRGLAGQLARQNAMRNPKRTARTASALMIGVALVSGVTVLASSLSATIEDTIGEQFTGDIAIDSGSFGPGGGFSPELTEAIADLPEVETAASLRIGIAEVGGDGGDFIGVLDPATAFEVIDIGVIDGDPTAVGADGILLLDSEAESRGLAVGDSLQLGFLDGSSPDLTVTAIYTEEAFVGAYAISQELYASTGVEQLDFVTYVQVADGTSIEAARTEIERVSGDYPNVEVQDRDEYIDTQSASLDQLLGLIYGLLGLAVIIAAFGIANTLRLSVIERTREIGLLRAVGMTQGQVRSTIRWESVITSVFGAVLGVVLGLFFGYAIIWALRDQGVTRFDVPVVPLLIVVVLAALVGVVASILPARRAARSDILDAIATT